MSTTPAKTAARPGDPARNVPSLAELQDLFQRAVMTGDNEILSFIPGSSRTSSEVLFGVYRYAYKARLREALAHEHEALTALMGREPFDEMASAYLDAYPSHHPNVRWIARNLPRFLAEQDPFAKSPGLAELASLEQALTDAFDAKDANILSMGDLQSLSPDSWGALTFTPHPSARRLTLTTNAFDIWSAAQDEAASLPGVTRLERGEAFLVWRRSGIARVRRLEPDEAMMWDEAMKATPFARLCELMAVTGSKETAPSRAAQYLKGWLESGLLRAPEA